MRRVRRLRGAWNCSASHGVGPSGGDAGVTPRGPSLDETAASGGDAAARGVHHLMRRRRTSSRVFDTRWRHATVVEPRERELRLAQTDGQSRAVAASLQAPRSVEIPLRADACAAEVIAWRHAVALGLGGLAEMHQHLLRCVAGSIT